MKVRVLFFSPCGCLVAPKRFIGKYILATNICYAISTVYEYFCCCSVTLCAQTWLSCFLVSLIMLAMVWDEVVFLQNEFVLVSARCLVELPVLDHRKPSSQLRFPWPPKYCKSRRQSRLKMHMRSYLWSVSQGQGLSHLVLFSYSSPLFLAWLSVRAVFPALPLGGWLFSFWFTLILIVWFWVPKSHYQGVLGPKITHWGVFSPHQVQSMEFWRQGKSK